MMRWKIENPFVVGIGGLAALFGVTLILTPAGFTTWPYLAASVSGAIGGGLIVGGGVAACFGLELADPQENAFCSDCGSAFTPMKKEAGFSKKTGKQQYSTTWQCPRIRPGSWIEHGRCGGSLAAQAQKSPYAGLVAQLQYTPHQRPEPGCFVHATVQLDCIVCRSNLIESGALTHEEAEKLK